MIIDSDWDAERKIIQNELNFAYDAWLKAIEQGNLEDCDRLWRDIDVVYEKMRNHLPITPTG